ncbi:acetylornithine aminotransferase [Penicillium sp. IBT 35674x]|nr:acetylornithine aminotransferase [Penicillium sp. IBT 35674x]
MSLQSSPSQLSIQAQLRSLIQQYETSHPLSKKAHENAKRVLPAGSTRSVLVSEPFPLVIKSAEGANITTVDGKTFENFISDYSAGIYGHSHPVIHTAIQDALAIGFSLGGVLAKEAELADVLVQRFPSVEKVRFCNSGTEANTFALATAVAYTGRKKILVFDNGYHGGTISFYGTSGSPMNLPHEFVLGRFNSIEQTSPLLNTDIAAILIEPMQSAGGMRPASRDFLAYLRQAATEIGAVLIFDEVVTSRLHYNGLQGAWGIIPDMTTLGKYLGGGFPFGAFGGLARIMDRFDSSDKSLAFHHSGTFNNNVFTMFAAVAASKMITPEEIQRLNGLGDRFREEANQIASQFGQISFTGYGSMIGIHFAGENADQLRDIFYFSLLTKGLSVGRRGFVALNLLHTEDSIDRLLEAVGLRTVLDALRNTSQLGRAA